jgi:D-xylonolactonase
MEILNTDTPQPVADYPCNTGEAPLWHPEERKVYWSDIPNGKIYRYDPATGESATVYEGEPVGGMTLQIDGSLLLFGARGAVRVWRDGKIVKTILDEIPTERDSRFNDVNADPEGRVFCGTMSTADRKGRLYRLDPDGNLLMVVEDVGTSNGMGFTRDLKRMYHTDTRAHEIYLYDYNRATGNITNRRVFAKSKEGEGRPDGMTTDVDGNVWSARWDGSRIVRYNPEGQETLHVMFPVKKVSCLIFAGDDMTDIYATTAGGQMRDSDGILAGALFHLRIEGAQGSPKFRSRIGL